MLMMTIAMSLSCDLEARVQKLFAFFSQQLLVLRCRMNVIKLNLLLLLPVLWPVGFIIESL